MLVGLVSVYRALVNPGRAIQPYHVPDSDAAHEEVGDVRVGASGRAGPLALLAADLSRDNSQLVNLLMNVLNTHYESLNQPPAYPASTRSPSVSDSRRYGDQSGILLI